MEGPWRAIGYGIFDGAEGKKAPIEPLETDDRCKRILLGTLGMKKDFASLEALCVTIGLLENAAALLEVSPLPVQSSTGRCEKCLLQFRRHVAIRPGPMEWRGACRLESRLDHALASVKLQVTIARELRLVAAAAPGRFFGRNVPYAAVDQLYLECEPERTSSGR